MEVDQPVLKTAPKHTRSRNGCYTCRKRKKRCDEVFDAEGMCGRCTAGGYKCDRVAPPAVARVSPTPTPYSKTLPTIRPKPPSSSSSASTSRPTLALRPQPTPPPPPPTSAAPPAAVTSYALPPAPAHYVPPPSAPILPHSQQSLLDAPPFDPMADLSYSSDLLTFFESLEPAVDPVAFTSNSDWFAVSTADAASGIPAQPEMGTGVSANLGSGLDGSTLAGSNAELGMNVASALVSEGERVEQKYEADQEAAIPIYHALNDGFFASLPPPVREVVKARVVNVAFSNDLSKSACMALCLLYRARMSQDSAPEARSRLTQESDLYFAKAVQQLQTGDIPLEAQILAVFDLELYQLEQYGAAAGYAILLLGDYFIQQQLGPRPSIDLLTLAGPSSVLLRCFACADAIRALALGNRATLFNFTGAPGASPLPVAELDGQPELISSEILSAVMGLPVGIVNSIAATCNLSVEEVGMEREEFEGRARAIERSIKTWRPVAVSPEQAEDSIKVMDAFVTHEMWRHAALIHVYQTLFHWGPLNISVQRALAQILALGARTSPSLDQIGHATDNERNTIGWTSERAAQWFLAGTVALEEKDRRMIREALRRCKPVKLAQDNLECIERIWAVTDERGHTVQDWRGLLEAEGRYVAFL